MHIRQNQLKVKSFYKNSIEINLKFVTFIYCDIRDIKYDNNECVMNWIIIIYQMSII